MEYEVKISYQDAGFKQTTSFCKNVNTLYELKQAFLKRLGNINDVPNKALKEKAVIKKFTYTSKSLTEWISSINTYTRWELDIRKI